MKVIYLIRHAESDWNDSSSLDFDRPLNNKGIKDVQLIANQLTNLQYNPSFIVCSPAKRTVETAEALSNNTTIFYEESIYEATLENLLHLINMLPNEHEELAFIGHNPSITNLTNYLTNNT